MSEKQKFNPYKEIQVVNLNDLNNMGAVAKKPFAILIWKDIPENEVKLLKEEIVKRCGDLIK